MSEEQPEDSGQEQDRPDKPVLFISHIEEHQEVAHVLRRFINTWTGKRVDVYQSTAPETEADGLRLGQNLNEGLQGKLWQTKVLLLIYTSHDEDWSYCMWECGVAQLPAPSATRSIVLQTGTDVPKVFEDKIRANLSKPDDIERFVNDLFTS